MKEYLINSGKFNIIVLPDERRYFILEADSICRRIETDFIEGRDPDYSALKPMWFRYRKNEFWHDFDNNEYLLDTDMSETDLISRFVLKKYNFGSLVAMRDRETKKVQIFKKDKLKIS